MIKDGIQYGISVLPEGNIPYREGYRYGAYYKNLKTGEMHVSAFFKTTDEITEFVKRHREYAKK